MPWLLPLPPVDDIAAYHSNAGTNIILLSATANAFSAMTPFGSSLGTSFAPIIPIHSFADRVKWYEIKANLFFSFSLLSRISHIWLVRSQISLLDTYVSEVLWQLHLKPHPGVRWKEFLTSWEPIYLSRSKCRGVAYSQSVYHTLGWAHPRVLVPYLWRARFDISFIKQVQLGVKVTWVCRCSSNVWTQHQCHVMATSLTIVTAR